MTKKGSTNYKAVILAAAAVCVVLAGLLLIYSRFRPQTVVGSKEITLDVVYGDKRADSEGKSDTDTYVIRTDAEYLEQALESVDDLTIEGHRTSQMGLMIQVVNGVAADYDQDQTYWSVELEGEPCNYGVSQQPIQDGEHYQLVLTFGGR